MSFAREACQSPQTLVGTLGEAKRVWSARHSREVFVTAGELAGVTFSIDFDDASLADPIFLTFGGTLPGPGRLRTDAAVTGSLRCLDAPFGWGLLVPGGSARLPLDGREFTFAVSMAEGPFDSTVDGPWTLIAFRGDNEPLIAFDGDVVLFRTDRDWRKAVSIFLFCQLLRVREDVIYLHAGSVAIDSRGILLIGPKGAGKSTTTMALAARGHRFLGDECGAYVTMSRSLLPFRRPVGIKPGPRPSAIAMALPRARRVVTGEGFIRVALEELIDVDLSKGEVPLDAVVFLRGFRGQPQVTRIEPSREDVAALQPIVGSFINAAGTRRVFQLVDMLAHARLFALHPADPDMTAIRLEEALSS